VGVHLRPWVKSGSLEISHVINPEMDRDRTEGLNLAHQLADLAAEISLGYFDRGIAPSSKADGSPVTEADFEVERQLITVLARYRPGDGIVSEEGGGGSGSSRRWILDPIDGTVNFVAGNPHWGSHIALEEDGEVVLGMITRPVLGQRWWATRNGAPFGAATQQGRRRDPYKSSVGQLLDGDLDAIVARAGGEWDHAPVVVLVDEAGGRFSDLNGGRRLDTGGGMYSSGRIHDRLLEILAHIGGGA
jgi:histidinol-phosphatase